MGIERISGCVGCGSCVAACPMDVLRLNEKTGLAEIRYPQDCQVCYLCKQYCPENAITIESGKTIPAITAWG
jgi:NAD-dependent dihydropyrimidine dehydrogenase PreA subunit